MQDCIEQICGHLGVENQLEQYEFAIYYVVEAGEFISIYLSIYVCKILKCFELNKTKQKKKQLAH